MPKTGKRTAGVTMLELLITIFVLLIGVTGVMGLFPVGVKLSQLSCDDIAGSMTAQRALAAVRLQPNLLRSVRPYTDENTFGDVLGWKNDQSMGVEGLNGSIGTVVNETVVQPSLGNTAGRTLDAKDNDDNRALLLMTSGRATWKVYRLDKSSSLSQFSSGATVSPCTAFKGDDVESGDSFRLLGARSEGHIWATVPAGGISSLPPFTLGEGVVKGYGYLAIVTRVHGYTNSFRVDILIYNGYDKLLPTEGNRPAVACYTTILSGDMLQ